MPDLPSFSPEFEACLGEGGWSLFTGFTVAGRVRCSCWVQSLSFLDISRTAFLTHLTLLHRGASCTMLVAILTAPKS